jgi:excisionase family DNA binding protein
MQIRMHVRIRTLLARWGERNVIAYAPMEEKNYTVNEVAAILRVTPRTIRRMIVKGEIKAFTVRGVYRIRESALEEYMDRPPLPLRKKDDR